MNVRNYNTRNFGPRSSRPRRRKRVTSRFLLFLVIVLGIAAVVVVAVLAFSNIGPNNKPNPSVVESGTTTPAGSETPTGTGSATPSGTGTSPGETAAASGLPADLTPKAIDSSDPAKIDLKTNIMASGKQEMTYDRPDKINFPEGDNYTKLEGVTTFRGNNYRTGGSYGTADIKEKTLEIVWKNDIGAIDGWSGVCWSGQPLIVKWPDATKKVMNLLDSAKGKQDLKEVIYPTADGHIYFLDLDTGDKTRKNPIDIGVPTKGTASIDPRGYPILYTGQGINTVNGKSVPVNFRIFSLIDQKLLWKFGGKDPFSYRTWQAYDSSPLIDAGSDTLVEGGENGVLYTAKLNTQYDEDAGTLKLDPKPSLVKYRYTTPEYANDSSTKKTRWYGIENSIVGWRNYAFFTDNGGTLQCVDLNTMKVVYAVDVTDDSDVSMPLEVDPANNTFYLYTGNEVDKQKIKNGMGYSYHRKINGLTGEIMWEQKYDAKYDDQGGGTLASPVLGKGDISNLIIYAMTGVPLKDKDSNGNTIYGGRIVAYDRASGKEAWRVETKEGYWSSPLAIYDSNGKAYIVQCDMGGYMKLYEGSTGDLLDTLNVTAGASNKHIEASPAAYGNMIVVGTRSQKIFGIKIK
jgi:hypothetical protein